MTGLVACGDHVIIKPDYRPVTITPPGMRWTSGVTLVADDQKFHIGNAAFAFRSGFTDRHFSGSAVRVPQQDLFGDSLLGLAVMGSGIALHLGDALDLSCDDEWRDFAHIMDTSGRAAWFWTPGNHDGFFFGNFVGPLAQWKAACHPAQPFTKTQILAKYLEHLASYAGVPLDPAHGSWSCPPGKSCKGLMRLAWQILDGTEYYKSYVIQEIDMPRPPDVPPASVILLDTSTYERSPRIAPSEPMLHYAAGEQGCGGPGQLAILDQWTARDAADHRTVVVAGHHPFNSLDDSTQAAIDRLVGNHRIATYISAHTHWGQYFAHTRADGFAWLEPNLGSIIDYESEFATLQLGFHEQSKFVRMTRSSTASFTTGARADLGLGCAVPEWLARPKDDDYYTRYMQSTSPAPRDVERLYYATMLAALDRYWRCVPTLPAPIATPGQCIPSAAACQPGSAVHASIAATLETGDLDKIRAKALELIALDRDRNVDPCLRREYRVCQSLWAAELEYREYVTPVRGEDVFEIHTRRATAADKE